MSLRGLHAGARSFAPSVRFLVVSVSGIYLALHADWIRGLLTIEEAGAAGTLTLQGHSYTHFDLAARLHCAQDPEGPEMRIILLSRGTARCNIRVAQVHGLKELEQAQILPLPRHFRGDEQRWYQGMILFEETVALVLNSAWILEDDGIVSRPGIEKVPGEASWRRSTRPVLLGGQTDGC